jgi:hypothetical protein
VVQPHHPDYTLVNVEQVVIGKGVFMSDQSDLLLPVLKAHDWHGAAQVVCRSLSADLESPYVPLVAFGYDRPNTIAFLNREDLAERSIEEVEREALVNLRARPVTVQPMEIPLREGAPDASTLHVLTCVDDYFVAERILDAELLQKLQTELNAQMIVVGIPRRGVLVAADGVQPPDVLGPFLAMVSAQYFTGETQPISPLVFGVVDGRIVGMVKGGEEAGKQIAAEVQAERDKEIFASATMITDPETGLESAEIVLGSRDIVSLMHIIRSVFLQVSQEHITRETFSGEIRFVILGVMTPNTLELQQAIIAMQQMISGVIEESGLVTVTGNPVQVSIQYDMASNTNQ